MTDYFACVGSRDTPIDILKVMIRLGKTLTDLGYSITTGGAFGADRSFEFGARQSKYFEQSEAKIYLIKDGFLGRRADNDKVIDVSKFKEMHESYRKLAEEARGSLKGLNSKGIALHSRNVPQVLGLDLKSPVVGMFLYSPTVGKNKVKGGTNTAYQLAKKNDVGIIKNLFVKEDLDWCLSWLADNEVVEVIKPIDWGWILKPKFDYKPDLDGIDHLNVYSKSNNRLGYLLSNWGYAPFTHPKLGRFDTVEGYYAYISSGCQLEHLRTASGWEAKGVLKELTEDEKSGYTDDLIEALYLKFEQNPEIAKLFDVNRTLPIVHYYYFGASDNPKIIPNYDSTWLEDTWTSIRNEYLVKKTLNIAKENK